MGLPAASFPACHIAQLTEFTATAHASPFALYGESLNRTREWLIVPRASIDVRVPVTLGGVRRDGVTTSCCVKPAVDPVVRKLIATVTVFSLLANRISGNAGLRGGASCTGRGDEGAQHCVLASELAHGDSAVGAVSAGSVTVVSPPRRTGEFRCRRRFEARVIVAPLTGTSLDACALSFRPNVAATILPF